MPRGVYDRNKTKEERDAEKAAAKSPKTGKKTAKAAAPTKSAKAPKAAKSEKRAKSDASSEPKQYGSSSILDLKGDGSTGFSTSEQFKTLHTHIAFLSNLSTSTPARELGLEDEFRASFAHLRELRQRTFGHLVAPVIEESEPTENVEAAPETTPDAEQETAPVQTQAPAPVVPTAYTQAPAPFNPTTQAQS